MIQVEFFKKGTFVYTMIGNIVRQYKIKEVTIKVLDSETVVDYILENTDSQRGITHLNSANVFGTKEELRDFVFKQFEDLKTESVGETKEEATKETIS